jgi:hypothetical protein
MRLNKTEPPAYHETERSTLAVFVFAQEIQIEGQSLSSAEAQSIFLV